MGDVVNTANRLQSAAPPGEVLVGPATYSATRRVVRYDPLDPIDVKGRDALVPAWRAEAATATPGYRGASARASLIGRAAEKGPLGHSIIRTVTHHRQTPQRGTGEAGGATTH